jgi:hypothetical protein
VSIAGYILGKKREREMLKSAQEQRKRDLMNWKEGQERRLAAMKPHRRAVERVRSTVGEKLLDVGERFEERGGILGGVGSYITGELAKKHALATHGYLLRTDPSYASRYLDQARYVSQMRFVAMTPEKWAEGIAHMIKTAPTKLEKIALIDKIARDTSMGRNILIKDAFGGLAEEVSWLTGGRIKLPISREIKAPAAFAIAAENASSPLVNGLGGRRPDVPHVTPANFGIGLVTRGLEHLEVPYIHKREPYTTFGEIYESISFYDTYSRPLSPEEKTVLSKTLANIYIEQPRLDGELVNQKLVDVAVNPPTWVDSRILEPYWIETQSHDVESLPSIIRDNIVLTRTSNESYEPGETHEGILYKSHDYGPQLSGDVQEAFPWASGDAIDRLSVDGYRIGEVSRWWETGEKETSSPTSEPKPDKSKIGGWWNE